MKEREIEAKDSELKVIVNPLPKAKSVPSLSEVVKQQTKQRLGTKEEKMFCNGFEEGFVITTSQQLVGSHQVCKEGIEVLTKDTQPMALQEEEVKKLEQDLLEAKSRAISANAEIELLREQTQTKDELLSELNAKLSKNEQMFSNERAAMSMEMKIKDNEIRNKDSQLQEARENLIKAQSAASISESENQQLKQQLHKALRHQESQLKEFQEKLTRARYENKQLKQQIQNRDEELLAKESYHTSQVLKLEQALLEAKSEATSASAEIQQLKQQIQVKDERFSEMHTKLKKAISDERSSINGKTQNSQSKVNGAGRRLSKTKSAASLSEVENKQLKVQKNEEDAQLKTLQNHTGEGLKLDLLETTAAIPVASAEIVILTVATHLQTVKELIWEARVQWSALAGALDVPHDTVEEIRHDLHYTNDGDRLERVLIQWMYEGAATIYHLLTALDSPTVNCGHVSRYIRALEGEIRQVLGL